MYVVFLELPRTILFLPSPPLARHREFAKAFPDMRLATHNLHVFVDAVVGFKLLITTLAH